MRQITNVNDNHKVLADWERLKALIALVEEDMLKFYGPTKTRRAGVRMRKYMKIMAADLLVVRKKINKQRQDYESEY